MRTRPTLVFAEPRQKAEKEEGIVSSNTAIGILTASVATLSVVLAKKFFFKAQLLAKLRQLRHLVLAPAAQPPQGRNNPPAPPPFIPAPGGFMSGGGMFMRGENPDADLARAIKASLQPTGNRLQAGHTYTHPTSGYPEALRRRNAVIDGRLNQGLPLTDEDMSALDVPSEYSTHTMLVTVPESSIGREECCSICHDEDDHTSAVECPECKAKFHKACLETSLNKGNDNCPCCRFKLQETY